VGEEPEPLYVVDFSNAPGAAEYRERRERARAISRQRYHDYLAAAFDLHGAAGPEELADVALNTLTGWRYVDSGERCPCSCHPRLPESDFHDYGFACTCTRAPEERGDAWRKWIEANREFWDSPEGQRIKAAELAEEAELGSWLATQRGVIVHSHGGFAPEVWRGEVDGHSFFFRERHGEWRIELDMRPSGHFAKAVASVAPTGALNCEERELDEGDVIARGLDCDERYGATLVERARFVADTIRVHLAQNTCILHTRDLSSIEALIGRHVRWCPACGTRLGTD
jgi:hypothetical protein